MSKFFLPIFIFFLGDFACFSQKAELSLASSIGFDVTKQYIGKTTFNHKNILDIRQEFTFSPTFRYLIHEKRRIMLHAGIEQRTARFYIPIRSDLLNTPIAHENIGFNFSNTNFLFGINKYIKLYDDRVRLDFGITFHLAHAFKTEKFITNTTDGKELIGQEDGDFYNGQISAVPKYRLLVEMPYQNSGYIAFITNAHFKLKNNKTIFIGLNNSFFSSKWGLMYTLDYNSYNKNEQIIIRYINRNHRKFFNLLNLQFGYIFSF